MSQVKFDSRSGITRVISSFSGLLKKRKLSSVDTVNKKFERTELDEFDSRFGFILKLGLESKESYESVKRFYYSQKSLGKCPLS